MRAIVNGPFIQLDMFEVQLGAALLLQFRDEKGRSVRVLADGGSERFDIRERLALAMQSFDDEQRIDLLIGTHYDEDHLGGLVRVIETTRIGEAWLPPVANDVEPHASDRPLLYRHLLAYQLQDYVRTGHRVLARYLNAKAQVCELLHPDPERRRAEPIESADRDELEKLKVRFSGYRREALEELEGDGAWSHADECDFVPVNFDRLVAELGVWRRWPYALWLRHPERVDWENLPEIAAALPPATRGSIAAFNLAGIRKAAATDAITAISLARVVDALERKGIPIRCHVIPDGVPQRFVWRANRFVPGAHLRSDGPTITLLGPSESLVRKHWHRLPIGVYAFLAADAVMRKKYITPSNQLSYLACLGAAGQRVLVSGDGGCVDFQRPRGRSYYPSLVGALQGLHVVQVAHHAGNNKDFYHVLQAAMYPSGTKQSFLLVSHATNDRDRPSTEFGHFIGGVRNDEDTIKILFTAQPDPAKVRDFTALIHDAVGGPSPQGDAQLLFDGTSWTVTKHAIRIEQNHDESGSDPSVALASDLRVSKPLKLVKRRRDSPR